MKRKLIDLLLFILIILVNTISVRSQESDEEVLNVFWKWLRWNDPGGMQINFFIDQADHYYNQRDERIARLKSRGDWLNRQALVREKLSELIGPFPEKTPLNPKITGVVKKDGYRIEKLVYESMPGLYVTGCLFIPDDTDQKKPAILNVMGHNQEAFRADLYQQVYLNLVKKGMIVLAIDPIGQGEMVQYYDPELGLSSIGYTVVEHFYLGNQCFLLGVSPARYFTWDGIRGIDYLISRPEVDPERIGVTGFSGGGTITSYISAVDERVKVSVPCSWSTASRRQTETKGTQDAETVFVHGLSRGITFEDLIEVRAPKPTLMTFTSRDQYLSIHGAREAYKEGKIAYKAFGRGEYLQYAEDDFKHWMTPKIRERIYAFFMEHFDIEGDPSEEEVKIIPLEELQVTSTGQVSTSLDSKSIFDINKKDGEKLIKDLERSRENVESHLDRVRSRAMELSGYQPPDSNSADPFFNGRYQRDGYSVSRIAIQGEGEYMIPILLFVPSTPNINFPGLVYLHPEGKVAEADSGGQIENLVNAGYVVAAIDPLGIGETKNTASRPAAEDYTAVMIRRSVVGVHAGDIVRTVNFLKQHEMVDPERIGGFGVDEMCIPLLHAAAFEQSIKNLTLIGSPVSYRSVVMNKIYRIGLIERENGGNIHPYDVDFGWGVAGVLSAYDLPDLVGLIAPKRVIMADLKNEKLEPAMKELIDRDLAFPRKVYRQNNRTENLRINPSYNTIAELIDWCFDE